MPARLAPFRLSPWFSERVWGRRDLRPWYESTGTAPVGEAWLTGRDSVVETGPYAGTTFADIVAAHTEQLLGPGTDGEFPLLVKLLFPEDKLSVQVHPDDAHARAMGQARGKTECWYVLEAKPGAKVALGLRPGETAERVAAAVADGTMEELMQWVPVSAGEMIFVDAGTVHAIGEGLVLLETQQTSDTTFRLYDYGRPRELHLEHGLEVMKQKTAAGKIAPQSMDGFTRLIEQRYFTVDRYQLAPGADVSISIAEAGCVVGLHGDAQVIAKEAEAVDLLTGRAVVLPASAGEVFIRSRTGAEVVRCFAPSERVSGNTTT